MHPIWVMPGDLPAPPFNTPECSDLTVHRNYVTQDILRRIMSDYFGYDVHFVMNVTDIDDKVLSSSHSVIVARTLKSSHFSCLFTLTDNHKGQAGPSVPGVPSR